MLKLWELGVSGAHSRWLAAWYLGWPGGKLAGWLADCSFGWLAAAVFWLDVPTGCQQRAPTIGQPAPARHPVLVDLQNLQTKSPQNTPPLLHNLTTLTVSTIIPDYLPYTAGCSLRGQVLRRNSFDGKYPTSIASSSASQMSRPVCISTSPPTHTTTTSSYATITLDSHSINRSSMFQLNMFASFGIYSGVRSTPTDIHFNLVEKQSRPSPN